MAGEELARAIAGQKARVGVVGLGYVGLPLVREFCQAGFSVLGFDVDRRKVEALERGESYIRHIPSSLVVELMNSGRFAATADYLRLDEADAILVCVPTPLTEMQVPDLSYVNQTAEQIAASLRSGQLIILESTTYPGTTREEVLPRLAATGLKPGEDFFVAYSPEREDPGSRTHTMGQIPKVVGGLDETSRKLAASLYGQVAPRVIEVSSLEAAEATKILENIYRSVNIALVNELKMLFDRMGINIWEVIGAAATKPFGFQAFYPGPGLGGHCIPIDPFYLSWKARAYGLPTRFIELAGEINRRMPGYVVEKLQDLLSARGRALKGAKVLLLGLAYKENVDDTRESPGIELLQLLADKGAETVYHDPLVPALPPGRGRRLHLESVELTDELLGSVDAVLIATAHDAVDYQRLVSRSALVLDTRNATRDVKADRDKIFFA